MTATLLTREAVVFAFLFTTPASNGSADLHHISAPDYPACIGTAIIAARTYRLPVFACDAVRLEDLQQLLDNVRRGNRQ